MSTVVQLGPHWKGFKKAKHLVVFGDSYSAVGYFNGAPRPSAKHPVGVPLPGITYNEPERPNWIGHLLTSYCDGRTDILVYDYAAGGHTVAGVSNQVDYQFLIGISKKPDWAPWTGDDSLFITWVGINDCAYMRDGNQAQKSIATLFDSQEKLYAAGARNFLFINIPPISRSPAVSSGSVDTMNAVFARWNAELRSAAESFVATHPDITAMVWSSWDTFTRILDDPVSFGFQLGHTNRAFGDIWFDRLHPTSAVHDIIARDVSEFLRSQPAVVANASNAMNPSV